MYINNKVNIRKDYTISKKRILVKMRRHHRLLEIHKIAVNKENEALRNSFGKKFIGENTRKTYAIADQWYSAFSGTSVYETWNFLNDLSDVILFIKENKSSVEKSPKKVVNKNLKVLSKKHPSLTDKLKEVNDRSLSWLMSRYGDRVEFEPDHPIEQAINTLLRYQGRVKGLRQKFDENVEYKNLFKNIGSDAINPSDIMNLSVNDMEMAIGLADRPRGIHTVIPKGYKPKEFLGQFGPWKLWLPNTRADSIAIAKYDKYSMKPDTDWCTARTFGNNLFYNYTTAGTFLFYAIKDGATKDNLSDYQSIGARIGILYGGDGTETVDGDNKGMTEESHQALFGDNYTAKIYAAITNRIQSSKGFHPAEKLLDRAAHGDEAAYEDLRVGASKGDLEDLEISINDRRGDIARDTEDKNLLGLFLNNKSEDIRASVAENPNISSDMMKKIIENDSFYVMIGLSKNDIIYYPENMDILETLSDIDSAKNQYAEQIITNISKNTETPFSIIKKLFTRKDLSGSTHFIRNNKNYPNHIGELFVLLENMSEKYDTLFAKNILEAMLANQRTTSEAINKIYYLSLEEFLDVDSSLILKNKNTSSDILKTVYFSLDRDDISNLNIIINHPSATPELLEKVKSKAGLLWLVEEAKDLTVPIKRLEELSESDNFQILEALSKNPSAYTEGILNRLIKFEKFREQIAKTRNSRLPPSISEKLSYSKSSKVRWLIAMRSDVPRQVLVGMAADTDKLVRKAVFSNKNTPITTVFKLSKEFGTSGTSRGSVRAIEYQRDVEAFEVIESIYEYRNILNNEGIDINQEMSSDDRSSSKLYSLARKIAEAGSLVFYEADLTEIDLTESLSVVWARNFINKNKENNDLSKDKALALSLAKEIVQESGDEEEADMANDKLGTLARWLLKSGFEKEALSIFSIYKESTLKIKVSPLEAAVALGLLPASILLDEDKEEDKKKTKKRGEDGNEDSTLEDLLKELREFELEKEAAKKKKKSKKKKDRTPTKPELWSASKAWAKRKYDVWPSAYAVGAALKRYKKKGGGWRGPKPKK
tara:strand:+ start:3959 stop:7108 length:3150 start_codon:yes stop_codon:yes gene_type:complete